MAANFPEITPVTLTGAEATYYTVTTGKKCLKLEFWLCNTHTSSVTVTLYAVANGAGAAVASQVFADSILPKKNRAGTIFLNLAAGGTLRGLASTSGVVSMRLAPAEV